MGKSFWISDDGQTGNFTNEGKDTFDPSKHYIGIRLQQGVPLLDRDWNELEDIRRYEEMMLRRLYIGDGALSAGFKIIKTDSATDFQITEGRCLIDGFEAVNESSINYSSQKDPITGNALPSLTLPAAGATRVDVVYIHLWVREEKGIDNKDVGMETCIRHKIEWLVKVNESKQPGGTPDYNYDREDSRFHHYYNIAEITHHGPDIISIKDLRKRPLKEGLTVDKDYNIGIGTSDPEAQLHVKGNILATLVKAETLEAAKAISSEVELPPIRVNLPNTQPEDPGSNLYSFRWINVNGKGVALVRGHKDNTRMLIGITNKGDLSAAGNITHQDIIAISDARLKGNIRPLGNVLDKFEKIRGISFEWDSLGSPQSLSEKRRQIGLIAQEVEEVFPELVAPSGREDYKGIKYNGMVAVLVEAIKELKESFNEIKELKSEIKLLKERLGIND